MRGPLQLNGRFAGRAVVLSAMLASASTVADVPLGKAQVGKAQVETGNPEAGKLERAHLGNPLERVTATAPDSSRAPANPYAALTNEQLAGVVDRWAALNQNERRWFFVEVRRRLTAHDRPAAIPFRPDVRFGQVVRSRSVGPGETAARNVRQNGGAVDARPARALASDNARPYGFGFERRRDGAQTEPPIPRGQIQPVPAAARIRAPPPAGPPAQTGRR